MLKINICFPCNWEKNVIKPFCIAVKDGKKEIKETKKKYVHSL